MAIIVLVGGDIWICGGEVVLRFGRDDVRRAIYAFLDDTDGPWDFDDCLDTRLDDPELDAVRRVAIELPYRFPPGAAGKYASQEGLDELRKAADALGTDNEADEE